VKSLQSRITLVTIGVAVIAVLITALVSFQLVRQSSTQDARATLARQADSLASVRNLEQLKEQLPSLGDTSFALVRANGTVTGTASGLVDTVIVARLARGDSFSTSRRDAAGHPFLIEARPATRNAGVVVALPQSTVEKLIEQSNGRVLIALGIGIAIAVIAGLLLGRWITRSTRLTAHAATRLSHGERGVSLSVRSPSEIAEIATALTALDHALSTSEGRQREFLLSISHELRTPLTAVRGYAEALADGMVPAAETATVGATLVAETERLDRFVADLLELARLESDDFSIRPQRVSLGELLEQSRDAWGGRATNLGVILRVAPEPFELSTDPQRVRQLVDGLVENALRVTPAGAAITIANAASTITVSDGGPGLSADDLAHAFERGVLRSRYREIRAVGTGLGLSIAARLAARLGGTISAGAAAGGGAEFRVELPRG
jgi:two-component system, OmpR family, sensor kinase